MHYIWSLYDKKSKSYNSLISTSSFAGGLRFGLNLFEDDDTSFSKFPLDYAFVLFGFFNDQDGDITLRSRIHYSPLDVSALLRNGDDLDMWDPLSSYYDEHTPFPVAPESSVKVE